MQERKLRTLSNVFSLQLRRYLWQTEYLYIANDLSFRTEPSLQRVSHLLRRRSAMLRGRRLVPLIPVSPSSLLRKKFSCSPCRKHVYFLREHPPWNHNRVLKEWYWNWITCRRGMQVLTNCKSRHRLVIFEKICSYTFRADPAHFCPKIFSSLSEIEINKNSQSAQLNFVSDFGEMFFFSNKI